MSELITCKDCNTPMDIGFIPDRDYSTKRNSWYPGSPEEIRAAGFKSPTVSLANQRDALPITAYRCPSCGVLKLFAHSNADQ